MTPSIDQILHQFATLLPNLTLLPILTLLPNFGGFHRTLQRVRLANRGRLLLRTPGPVPFGTCIPYHIIISDDLSCSCICSHVETVLSWTCHVYGPFEFWTSLCTSILLHWETSRQSGIWEYMPPCSVSIRMTSLLWKFYKSNILSIADSSRAPGLTSGL